MTETHGALSLIVLAVCCLNLKHESFTAQDFLNQSSCYQVRVYHCFSSDPILSQHLLQTRFSSLVVCFIVVEKSHSTFHLSLTCEKAGTSELTFDFK